MLKILCTAIGLLSISTNLYAADLIYTKWDKGRGHRMVAAIDLATRAVRWEINPCRTANFAEPTSVGILVGCDDSNVILLDAATGKELWRRDLAMIEPDPNRYPNRIYREIKVNRFHYEKPEGFFVSFADEIYVLMGRDGAYLMRCDVYSGCVSNPKPDREAKEKNG